MICPSGSARPSVSAKIRFRFTSASSSAESISLRPNSPRFAVRPQQRRPQARSRRLLQHRLCAMSAASTTLARSTTPGVLLLQKNRPGLNVVVVDNSGVKSHGVESSVPIEGRCLGGRVRGPAP